jgi:hypothetical protein
MLDDFDFVDCGKCAVKTARKSPYLQAKSDSTPQIVVVIGSPSQTGSWCGETEKGLLHHHHQLMGPNADRFV